MDFRESSMTGMLLAVENLMTYFRTSEGLAKAVDGISFTVDRGETFALVGESGCGKSVTALSILRLLQQPAGFHAGGHIFFRGTDLTRLSEHEMRTIRGNKISMIFQEPMTSLNPVFTVGSQIIEVMQLHQGLGKNESKEQAIAMLKRVGIADPALRYHQYPHQLSGGMLQRVMIAIALACHPELLIADEPTTSLDVTIQDQILTLLQELGKDFGMSILLITHDLGIIYENAHRVAVMYAGTIVEMGSKRQIFEETSHPYTVKLLQSIPAKGKRGGVLQTIRGALPRVTCYPQGCRFADRCPHTMHICRATSPVLTDTGNEHHVACHLYEGTLGQGVKPAMPQSDPAAATRTITMVSAPRKTLLSVNRLRMYFPIKKGIFKRTAGYVKAVDGVDLSIAEGMTMALVGESGCGKTTLGKAIIRLLHPSAGSVIFDGVDLAALSLRTLRHYRKHFQIVFQDPFSSLNPRMMVGDIIEEAMIPHRIGSNRAERMAILRNTMDAVGLNADMLNRYPHEFSGGQRQRIAIARVLTVQPKLLICDEATSALDVSIQAQILNLFGELKKSYSLTYLFITHNLSVVEYLSDTVAVMYLGRIVEQGTTAEVFDRTRHPYTRALLAAAPSINPSGQTKGFQLTGDVPSPITPPAGCHFHPRCPCKMPACEITYPPPSHFSATHSCTCYLYSR